MSTPIEKDRDNKTNRRDVEAAQKKRSRCSAPSCKSKGKLFPTSCGLRCEKHRDELAGSIAGLIGVGKQILQGIASGITLSILNPQSQPNIPVTHVRFTDSHGPRCKTPGLEVVERWWPVGHDAIAEADAQANPGRVTCNECRRLMAGRGGGL